MDYCRIANSNIRLQLGTSLGDGGEGQAYCVVTHGYQDKAVKIFDSPSRAVFKKISHMLPMYDSICNILPPSIMVCWPEQIVVDESTGQNIGYIMTRVPDALDFAEIADPRARQRENLYFSFFDLIDIVYRLGLAIEALHRNEVVLCDINPKNVLITRKKTVAIIDTDSMQLRIGGNTKVCEVAMFDFLAPELHSGSLKWKTRKPSSDIFTFGVMIFKMIYQNLHPYSGTLKQDNPSITCTADRIPHDYWMFGKHSNKFILPEKVEYFQRYIFMSALAGDDLWGYFDKMFTLDTECRPVINTLASCLEKYIKNLTPCTNNRQHYYLKSLKSCPWCDLAKGGSEFFPERPCDRTKKNNIVHPPKKLPPKVVIEKAWITHNENSEDSLEKRKGCHLHIKFKIHNCLKEKIRISWYFHYKDGKVLKDFNNSYSTTDGNVSAGDDGTPRHDDSVYNDFFIFMPYDELHLSRGKYLLECYCVIWKGDTEIARLDRRIPFRYSKGFLLQHGTNDLTNSASHFKKAKSRPSSLPSAKGKQKSKKMVALFFLVLVAAGTWIYNSHGMRTWVSDAYRYVSGKKKYDTRSTNESQRRTALYSAQKFSNTGGSSKSRGWGFTEQKNKIKTTNKRPSRKKIDDTSMPAWFNDDINDSKKPRIDPWKEQIIPVPNIKKNMSPNEYLELADKAFKEKRWESAKAYYGKVGSLLAETPENEEKLNLIENFIDLGKRKKGIPTNIYKKRHKYLMEKHKRIFEK